MGVMIMNINSLRYSLRQSIVSLSRNFWLAMVTAGMIAISLAILGGFLLLVINTNQILDNFASNVEIAVFLHDDANQEEVSRKLDNLENIKSYTFISKEDGLIDFSESLGDRALFSGIEGDNNPLPDMFRVLADDVVFVPEIAREIRSFSTVESVDYGEQVIESLIHVSNWLNTFLLGVSFLLAASAVFLIVTTIRLSVLSRQEEIGVMKFLGASNWFVRLPFLLEGLAMGWLGTFAASAALGLVYYRVIFSLPQEMLTFLLQPVTDFSKLFPVFASLFIMGTLLGCIGSIVSIRKFLRV